MRFMTHLLAIVLISSASLLAPNTAGAAEGDVQISAEPVGRKGSYFRVKMSPGKTKRLKVALRNNETLPVAMRTYATNAYTIPNGGMGVGLADDPKEGTALWISYPEDVFTVGAESQRTRSFEVSVPPSAEPGEYIAAIVVQNNDPIRRGGREGVQINQVLRHAVAVSIQVPGELKPQMTIGSARDALVGGRTMVSVGIENTGNQHLTPQADMVLRSLDGKVLAQQSIDMNTVYAGTESSVEMMLSGELLPGDYTVELQLVGPALGAPVQSGLLPLTVTEKQEAVNPKADTGTGGRVAELLQSDNTDAGLWARTLGPYLAAMALAAVFVLILLIVRRRRRRSEPEPPAAPGPRMPRYTQAAGWPPPAPADGHMVGAGSRRLPPPSGPPTRPAP